MMDIRDPWIAAMHVPKNVQDADERQPTYQARPRQIDFNRVCTEVMLRFRKTLAYLAK